MYAYDPRLKSKEELKATEFLSQKTIDEIIKSLTPDSKGNLTNQSWLIYGSRGMGKSHILTLTYHKIKDDKKLSNGWLPILCPEELYTVNSLYRLFKEFGTLILNEIEKQYDIKEVKKYQEKINEINKIRILGNAKERKEKERELTNQYLEIFLEINKTLKKKFIFFIENLQELFSKQISEDEQKYLRDIFYQYPKLMIWLASAVQIPGKLMDYGTPFYHFFRIRKMEGMSSEEIINMLFEFCKLDENYKLQRNLKEMESDISVFGLLSGGNPRLIVLLYKFLENGEVKGVKEMMKVFISDLTPYFQRETETLTNQQKLVIDSLSLNVFPLLTIKDITYDSNLPEPIVSSQVNKLRTTHWLRTEKVASLKSELFILNEYIYRVWYQMRMGGIYQENARWTAEFLSFIFPIRKIREKVGELEKLISETNIKDNIQEKDFLRSELGTYKMAVKWQETKEVKRYFEILRKPEEMAEKEIKKVFELIDIEKYEEALIILDGLIEKNQKYYGSRGLIKYLLNQLLDAIKDFDNAIKLKPDVFINYYIRGLTKADLGQYSEAVMDFNKAIELNPEDASAYYNRGNTYSDLKEYDKAITDYTKAIALNPEDASAYYNRGNTYSDLKEYDKAITDYTKAIELNPEDDSAYYNRGKTYSNLREYDKAITDYTKVIELNPEYASAYYNRGTTYLSLREYEKAITDYTKAIALNPEDASAYYNRGNTYLSLREYDKAITDYTKAIELNPEDDSAYYNRGNTYSDLREYEKAITDYTKAIELNPEDASAYYNRGTTYSDLREYDKAITDYTKAIELNPEDASAYYNRGNTYSDLREYEKAITDYTKSIELNPEDALVYNNRGNTYSDLREYEKATTDYTKSIELNPEYASAYYNRGTTYSDLREYEKAITDYTKSIELNPEDALAYNNRGNTYLFLKEYDKAINDYTKVIELNPEDALAYYNRGTTYSDLREYDKAITDYTKAIELNPEDALAYYNRGTTYSDLREYDKAIKDYTKAIELNPELILTYKNRISSNIKLDNFEKCIYDFMIIIQKTGFIIYMQDASNLISKYIDNKYKVTSSIQNLFEKDKSDDKILKHILILLHFKQNDIIKTYFSENGYKILKNSTNPYPLIISFTALFNLIELVKSGNPQCKELAKLWINITKNIEFTNDEEKENIFNKSLMLIYTLAIKDEKSAELTKDVLNIINSKYHSIAESHFYIPQALVNEKTPEVEKLMKDTIFRNTLEKIKLQRVLLEK